jgi:hypothetical protein
VEAVYPTSTFVYGKNITILLTKGDVSGTITMYKIAKQGE